MVTLSQYLGVGGPGVWRSWWGGWFEGLQGRCALWNCGSEGEGGETSKERGKGAEEVKRDAVRTLRRPVCLGGGGGVVKGRRRETAKETEGGSETRRTAKGALDQERGEEGDHSQMLSRGVEEAAKRTPLN